MTFLLSVRGIPLSAFVGLNFRNNCCLHMYVCCVLFYGDADSGINGNYNTFEVGLRDELSYYFEYFETFYGLKI